MSPVKTLQETPKPKLNVRNGPSTQSYRVLTANIYRPPVGLLALQRMVELGLGQRQHQFDPYEQPDINPRRRRTNKNNDHDEDSDDSKENRQRQRKSKKN